jgi:hypothetical protein
MLSDLPDEILVQILSCVEDGKVLAAVQASCKALRAVLSQEEVWETLCDNRGFKQLSATRTRGHRPWKEVFVSNLCVECRCSNARGIVKIDLAGGSHNKTMIGSSDLVPLCVDCVRSVQAHSRFSDRQKFCLPSEPPRSSPCNTHQIAGHACTIPILATARACHAGNMHVPPQRRAPRSAVLCPCQVPLLRPSS